MRRKLGLIGGSQGPWVRTDDFTQPEVRVILPAGTVLHIALCDEHDPHSDVCTLVRIDEAGSHRLNPSLWMRALVVEGPTEGVVCTFVEAA